MKKIAIVLDDSCKSNSGGTALTLQAIASSLQNTKFEFIQTNELSLELFNKIPTNIPWILGNISNVNFETIKILFNILQFRKFIKIEFDYGFCRYRCETGYKNFTGKNEWTPFDDQNGSLMLKNIYMLTRSLASKIFYMSKEQMEIHNKMMPFSKIESEKQIVLGSCFDPRHLMLMLNKYIHKNKNQTQKVYAIVDGNGGWHSKAKGVKDSVIYAKENNLNFQIIKSNNYTEFLNVFSSFYGCIFLPIIHDTCPRLTIEAKLLGLDLITNDNCQHIKEDWFKLQPEDMANYLLERPNIFIKELENIL